MPSVQLPPKESALFKRVLVSGGAATHPTSARFVYFRAGLSRGSPPPRAASAASVPTASAFQKLLGRGSGVPASGRLPSAALASVHPSRRPSGESRLLRGQAGARRTPDIVGKRVTAVRGAEIEPAFLGSQCRCAGEFACVWCPVWELTCQKLLLLTRPSDESCGDRFALETIYVALKQAQIITFLGQGRPMPKQERFAFIFRFFLRQAYYVALTGPDLYVDKASLPSI